MIGRTVSATGTGDEPSGPLSSAPDVPPPVGGAGPWKVRGRVVGTDVPVIMGVLNVTPDSFSDGGELAGVAGALHRAAEMVREGATILDVGGESTRPGAAPVPEGREIERVVPVIEALVRRLDVVVSVDTRKAEVARAALDAGAHVVNDVSGLARDPGMAEVVATSGAGLVLMHMRGSPGDMDERAHYHDLVGEVVAELGEALARARSGGVGADRVVVDPGFGFAKTGHQNLVLLRRLSELATLGRPVLVGPSRKRFLGEVLGVPPRERDVGTAAACALAYLEGARIFRVHDVRPAAHALAVAHAMATARA